MIRAQIISVFLLLAWLLGGAAPAQAAGVYVHGVVRTDAPGLVASGTVTFYASCEDFEDDIPAASSDILAGSAYGVSLPPGTYRVRITPTTGLATSWHNAQATCADAGPLTITVPTTVDLYVRSARTVTGGVTAGGIALASGRVSFFRTCQDQIDDLPAGSVDVIAGVYSVQLPNGTYLAMVRSASAGKSWHPGVPTCAQAQVITVQGSGTQNLQFTQGVKVAGTVTSPHGQIQEADVSFFASCDDAELGTSANSTWFDDGDYDIVVPTGTYRVRVNPGAGQPAVDSWNGAKATCAESTPVTITGAGAQALTVSDGYLLTGAVKSKRGTVQEGTVLAYATCEDYAHRDAAASADFTSGSYALVLPAGTYRLFVNPADEYQAADSWHNAAATCAEADVVTVEQDRALEVHPMPAVEVTGLVKYGGTGVDDGDVEFYRSCQDLADGKGPAASSRTDSNGNYVANPPEGTYRVRFGFYPAIGETFSWYGGASCAEAPPVEVKTDRTLDFTFPTLHSVAGPVVSTQGAIPTGSLLFYRNCQAYADNDEAASGWFFNRDFGLRLPAGTYRVLIDPGYSAAKSWHNAKPDCASADQIEVSDTTTVQLVADAGLRMTGSVSSSAGPIAIGQVVFYRDCQSLTENGMVAYRGFRDGTYSVRILPGTYVVFIYMPDVYGAMPSWHSAKATCAEATPVTLTAAGVLDLRALRKGGEPVVEPPVEPPPVEPPPVQPPPASPALKAQTVKKLPSKMKKGKRIKLEAKTSAGVRITWRTSSKKICKVNKGYLKALKRGKCTLAGSAPVVSGYSAWVKKYTIRVR